MAVGLCIAGGVGIGTANAEDVQVNTFTTGFQLAPWVALEEDGDFVVLWRNMSTPGLDVNVRGQRYAANGSTVGGEFHADTDSTGAKGQGSVALGASGDFVLVWASYVSVGTDTSQASIQGQRFAADGSPVGDNFQVNTYTTGDQDFPRVAVEADGDFVVVWVSDGSSGTDSSDRSIQGQRYASDGSTAGGEFQVNTYTTDKQHQASVALDAEGDFVIVWGGYDPGIGFNYNIRGQRYASDGSAAGGEFQINTYTSYFQGRSAVALDADGDFVVVWSSNGSSGTDSSGYSIQSQRYASDGSAVGGELQVNTYTTGGQVVPKVALDADGDAVVVWCSNGSSGTDSSDASVQGRRLASDGSAVGDEFQINTYTTSAQSRPEVAVDADGDLIVVWESLGSGGTDTDSYSIQKTPAKQLIFADGFESGDTSVWD